MNRINVHIETRVAIFYALFGGLWILFSDSLLETLVADYELYAKIQTYKGWFFVAASAILIFYLIKHNTARQRETAAKLQASEEALRRFELLSEHSRDIILFMGREDGRILEANFAAIQAYGYTRDELLSLTVRDLRAHDSQNRISDQMAQADSEGILFETTHKRKDGSTFPVEISSQGASIGGMRTLISIVRDITERKRAEEEIESLSKFPTENPNPILRVQHDGQVTYANTASQELLAMWGCKVGGYLPQEWKALIVVTLESGAVETRDVTCKNKTYSLLMVPIEKAGYVNLYGSDISERKGAEQALRDSETRYRNIMENSVEAIYLYRLDDKHLVTGNPAFLNILGYETDEITSLTMYDIVAEDQSSIDDFLQQILLEGGTSIGERLWRRKDGTTVQVEVTANKIQQIEGELVFVVARDITERKQAEEKVQRNQAMLRAILDQMPSGVTVREAHSEELLLSNTRSQEILKTLVDTPAYFDHYQGFHSDGSPYHKADWPLSRSIATGEIVQAEEIDCKRSDETWMSLSISSSPVRDLQGQIVMGVSVFDDITERKRAEEALRESEERLRLSLHAANQGLYDLNVQTGAAIVNSEYAEMLGYDPETFVESNADWIARLHPDDKAVTEKAYRDYINGVLPEYRVEFRQKTRDGNWKWILSSGKIVESDTQGKPLRMLGTHTDITQRKQAEELLRENEAFVKTVLDNLPVGIAVNSVDPTVTFNYMNDNFPKFYRTTRENLADQDAFWNAVYEDPDFREQIKKRVLDDVASGELEHMHWEDVPITRKGKETTFITARNIPIPGKPFMISTVWDVTERKQAVEELRQALEELKRSNTELEEFAYVASHDLQEPLRGIAGLAQLLQQRYYGQLDSRADEYITHIVEGTQRMQTLINDLLTYSRIGRRETIQTTSAEVALKAAAQNLSTAIQEYSARITNESLPTVRADATQLIQLFQNLIGNAIKFRSERQPHIHVSVTDAGNFWQFSICDNGIGIDPQYFERIFQVFQRLHTRREYKGTGIGLAICKKITDRLGGKIWVESEPEQGSTFYFTLPKGG